MNTVSEITALMAQSNETRANNRAQIDRLFEGMPPYTFTRRDSDILAWQAMRDRFRDRVGRGMISRHERRVLRSEAGRLRIAPSGPAPFEPNFGRWQRLIVMPQMKARREYAARWL